MFIWSFSLCSEEIYDVGKEDPNREIIFSDEYYEESEIDPSIYLEESPLLDVDDVNINIDNINETIIEEDITVIGEQEEPVKPSSTLDGAELTRELGSTLGESLQNQPGVHNATFGPGVGLPVIRGMSGSRVQILQGSMGTYDASSVSPDHAVTIEPLLAEEITILRGPDTLRYSGTAMGGAVDVKTGRIPDSLTTDGFDGAFETRYDTNSELFANVFKIDTSKGPFAFHLDGYDRSSNNIDIPGSALNEPAVLEQFGNLIEFENTQGTVLNSDSESTGYSIGSSLVLNQGFIGVAVNELDNNYGIPPGGIPPHNDDPTIVEVTPENLRIDMQQTRWDATAEIYDVLMGIESLSIKVANIDYNHAELSRGQPATTFDSKATEARIEMEYSHNEIWQGVVGYQWSEQNFGAVGVESFIPYSDIERKNFFIIESVSLNNVNFDIAYRYESQKIVPEDDVRILFGVLVDDIPDNFDHTARSISSAFQFDMTDELSLRLSATKAQRTPAVQELLSLGPHFATRTYELGNYFLENEESFNLDIGITYRTPVFDFSLNAFRNKISDYIYLERGNLFYDIETGGPIGNCVQLTGCLPFYGYFQQDANFFGYETQFRFRPPIVYGIDSEIGIFSDYVRGYFKEDGAGDVPRLPPQRVGIFLDSSWRYLDFNFRWTHAFEQNRPGLEESETDGYDRVDIGINFNPSINNSNDLMVFLKAKNITDAEIRHSTSFIRNFTPEPGRSFEFGLRWVF